MDERATAILNAALQLPARERLELADALYDSFGGPVSEIDSMTDEELVQELDRRAEELRLHPERAIPWEEVVRITRSDLKS